MKKMLVSRRAMLGLGVASVMTYGWAEESQIEEVVVWGTEVKASSLGFGEEAIAIRQVDHLSDLLRTVPGVDVGGAHSLNQRITIRSMDDKDLRVSIDGANQNTYMYHHMGNLQIHADILKSVEIDVGRNSVINGGLGGTVRFETRDANDLLRGGERFGARANVSVADNGSNSYSLTGYGQLSDSVDMLLYYNTVDRSNFRVGGGDILDADGKVVDDTDGKVRGLEGEVSDALIKLGWNVSNNQRLKIGHESYVDEGDYSYRPDMGLATDMAIANSQGTPLLWPTKFSRDTTTFNHELDIAQHSTINTAIYQNISSFWRDERDMALWPRGEPVVKEGEAENQGINILANTQFTAGVEHELTYGVDAIHYQTQLSKDGVEVGSEWAKSTGVFVEDRIHLGRGFSLTPGVRYQNDNVESHLTDKTFDDTQLALAIEYQPGDDWVFRASVTEIFKAPELAEVFTGAGVDDAFVADIKAESGTNSEIGYGYQGERWATGLTLFNTQIDHFIFDYSPGKDNIGHMTIKGFETYLEYSYSNLTALLTLSSADGELDAFSEYPEWDGAGDNREQGDTVSINVDYRVTALDLSLHWDVHAVDDLAEGLYLDSPDLRNAKDGFIVHNISARWTPSDFARGLALTIGVDNLLDEFYASQSSRTGLSFHPVFDNLFLTDYEPGRNIKASLAYQF